MSEHSFGEQIDADVVKRVFCISDFGKPSEEHASCADVLARVSEVRAEIWQWSLDELNHVIGKYPPRLAWYESCKWYCRPTPLAQLRPWPRMGGLPDEACRGSVVDTAKYTAKYGVPQEAMRLRSFLHAYETSPACMIEVCRALPLIALPEALGHARPCLTGAPWTLDDGNHRAVILARDHPGGAVDVFIGIDEAVEEAQALTTGTGVVLLS